MKQPSIKDIKVVLENAGYNSHSVWGYNDVRTAGKLASVGSEVPPNKLLRRIKLPGNWGDLIHTLKDGLNEMFKDHYRIEIDVGVREGRCGSYPTTNIYIYSK